MRNLSKRQLVYLFTIPMILIVSVFAFYITAVKKVNEQAETAKLNDLRTSITESVRTSINKQKQAEIDSIKQAETIKTFRYRTDALYWKGVAQSNAKAAKKSKLKADSLAKTKPECADVAEDYQITVDSLMQENNALDKVNEALDKEAESYSTRLWLTEKQLQLSNEIILNKDSVITAKNARISVLEKQAKTGGFWKGFKWGFGAGYVSGIGTAIAIKF